MTQSKSHDSIEAARRRYAEQLRKMAHVRSDALVEAFATVPRERFVGPGPWFVPQDGGTRRISEDDPQSLYENILIALDQAKGINNGEPSLWAEFLDWLDLKPGQTALHLGCGTGYYTAIVAEVVGLDGRVTAVEIDPGIAERARQALALWPQVAVLEVDGAQGGWEPVHAVVVSAGATHPLASWLDALTLGGRLVFPLTSDAGPGAMACLQHINQNWFTARLEYGAQFIPFSGARDEELSRRLAEALERDRGSPVRSMRRDAHEAEESCWLHGEGWCFSQRVPT